MRVVRGKVGTDWAGDGASGLQDGFLHGRVWFGAASFDPAAMRLTVAGAEVAVEPRPLRLLALLLERPGAAVTKEVIMERLWPGRLVTESSLTKCVGRLRLALKDADHATIRTVHGLGYRLDAEVSALPPAVRAAPSALVAAAAPAAGALPRRRLWRAPMAAAVGVALFVSLGMAVVRHQTAMPHGPLPRRAQILYASGKLDWAHRTPASLMRAVAAFSEALRIAPDYAHAYAGLADCYNLLPEYSGMSAAQAYPLAKAAALRAIALAPDLAEAHGAYAFALYWGDWDFRRALEEYRRALLLKPNDATTHHWYATSLDNMGDHAAAVMQIDQAATLDPASNAIRADRGLLLFNRGQIASAKRLLRALETGAPDFASPHRYLSQIAFAEGDDEAGLREWEIASELQHDLAGQAVARAGLAGFKASGAAGRMRAVLDARLAGYAAGTVSAADVARSYAESGSLREALAYLDLAVARHDPAAIFLLNSSEWRPYLQDPATRRMLARLGLE